MDGYGSSDREYCPSLRSRHYFQSLPNLLRGYADPAFYRLVTAYALGLLSSAGPRVARVLFLLLKGKLHANAAWSQVLSLLLFYPRQLATSQHYFIPSCKVFHSELNVSFQIRTILRQATAYYRFPTFCGTLVGGSTILQYPIRSFIAHLLRALQRPVDHVSATRLARFVATLFSASISFILLNKAPPSPQFQQLVNLSDSPTHFPPAKLGPFDEPPEPVSANIDDAKLSARSISRVDLAGRTIDLTLFSVIRALDVVILVALARMPASATPKLQPIRRAAPISLFCFSAATIMHSWFYSPSRLPQTYNRWISAAAQLDHRLLLALRHARYGTWVYGKDTGMAPLLGSMCDDYGLDPTLGDPAKTVPIPCELVHMGTGKSCEKHALLRFWRGWKFAAKMYAPLQLVVLARSYRKHAAGKGASHRFKLPAALIGALSDLTRNSAFLGAFISFFYYGVCLSRTRLGPRLFSYKSVTPQMWDSGLCVLGGCLLCGLSILVEQPRKRLEIIFFVLPRAAAAWFPRRYLPEHKWREQLAFSLSAAVVLSAVQEQDGKLVRGVLGDVLGRVMSTR